MLLIVYILLDNKDLVSKLASSSTWSLGQNNHFSLPIIFSLSCFFFFLIEQISLEDKQLSLSSLVDTYIISSVCLF